MGVQLGSDKKEVHVEQQDYIPPHGGPRRIIEERNGGDTTQNIGVWADSGEQRYVSVVRRGSKLCGRGTSKRRDQSHRVEFWRLPESPGL